MGPGAGAGSEAVKAVDSELGSVAVEAAAAGCCGLSGDTGGEGSGCVLASADGRCGASDADDSAIRSSTELSPLWPAIPTPAPPAAPPTGRCRLPSASASSLLSAPLLTDTEAADAQALDALRLRESRCPCCLLSSSTSGAWLAMLSCTAAWEGGGIDGRYSREKLLS